MNDQLETLNEMSEYTTTLVDGFNTGAPTPGNQGQSANDARTGEVQGKMKTIRIESENEAAKRRIPSNKTS